MVELSAEPLALAPLRDHAAAEGHGAILVFEGTTRDTFEGRPVLRLEYEAYTELALSALQAIVDECEARWPCRVAIAHRTGVVPVGEPSVLIVVGAPHRAECYEASRHAIDELKARVPIWKKEVYADGSVWKANAPA